MNLMIRVFKLGRHEMTIADDASMKPQIKAGIESSRITVSDLFLALGFVMVNQEIQCVDDMCQLTVNVLRSCQFSQHE